MSKKLTGNGLYESSRMILAEHRKAIIKMQHEANRKQKPILHEDEWQIIFENINLSIHSKEEVCVTIFGEYEDRDIQGVVTSVNQYSKKFKIEFEGDFEWIDFSELISVRGE